jgi:beta-phosphoglucomutase-like phosphatase (HAD superfamily)
MSQSHIINTHLVLFDLDGTLINSVGAVVAFWHNFAKLHDLDAKEILRTSHGRRTLDVLTEILPEENYTSDKVSVLEATIPNQGVQSHAIVGARTFLNQLDVVPGKWAIVTSGSAGLASGWFNYLGWEKPSVFITSECVTQGKPHPDGYILGGKTLLEKSEKFIKSDSDGDKANAPWIVFEDAPAGIKAGKSSGAVAVIAVATTYDVQILIDAGADYVVKDYTNVSVTSYDENTGNLKIEIKDPLYARV